MLTRRARTLTCGLPTIPRVGWQDDRAVKGGDATSDSQVRWSRSAFLEGETILEGLYRNGYAYRVGCRRIAICKVDLVSGEVGYNRPVADNVCSEDERAAGTCLSCRAVPSGDVTITLREENLRRVRRWPST